MTRIRHSAPILLATLVALMTLAGVAQAGMMATMRDDPGAATPADTPVARSSGDGPMVAAVVLGRSPTVGSDVLAPYEVFASHRSSRSTRWPNPPSRLRSAAPRHCCPRTPSPM